MEILSIFVIFISTDNKGLIINIMKRNEFDYELIHRLYNSNGESITEIAKKLNVGRQSLTAWMKRNNFIIDSKRKKTNEPIVLTDEQEEILYGGLLGDCCLTNNGKSEANAQITYTSSIKDHVAYFKSFFVDICVTESKD